MISEKDRERAWATAEKLVSARQKVSPLEGKVLSDYFGEVFHGLQAYAQEPYEKSDPFDLSEIMERKKRKTANKE